MSFATTAATQAFTAAAATAVLNCDAAVGESLTDIAGGIVSNADSNASDFGGAAGETIISMSSAPSQIAGGLWRSINDSVGSGAMKVSSGAMKPDMMPSREMYNNPGFASGSLCIGGAGLTVVAVILGIAALKAYFAAQSQKGGESPKGATGIDAATPAAGARVSGTKADRSSDKSDSSPLSQVGVSGHKTGTSIPPAKDRGGIQ